MGLEVYIVYSTNEMDEIYKEYVEGIFYDEETAKEVVDILNNPANDEDEIDKHQWVPWLKFSYYRKKVYGTVEDFIKEREE